MNPEVKEKFVEALLSGRYKKCTGRLSAGVEDNVKKMCYLGVLEDVYNQEHGKNSRGYSEVGFPSRKVLKWAGLDKKTATTMMIRNDGLDGTSKWSFAKLAKYTRERL